MRSETLRNEKLLNKIKEMYEPIQKIEYEENNIVENENHTAIMDELMKKEKEKESLLKEKNLINEEIKELLNTKHIEISKNEELKKNGAKIENEKVLNESKSNLNSSRKPKLDFGKNSLNNNNYDFSHLLVDENEKEEEKEPLDESIVDEENNNINKNEYEEPIEIDKDNQNIYFDKEEVDEKKINFENEENKEEEKNKNNINEKINDEKINDEKTKDEKIKDEKISNAKINSENKNNEKKKNEKINNEELLKEKNEQFIKNFHEKMNSKINEKIENEEEEINDEEREKQFNELLKEAQPKKGKDSHPVDFNHFHDII